MHPGEVLASRFEIERLAGSGGTGSVYRARDLEKGGLVAIKILHGTKPEIVERFAREARVLSALEHPGIVKLTDNGLTAAGEPYLAMEWLDGEDLAQRLARAPLTQTESVSIATRAAEALAVAHARGIVHRDVKPSNLFLVGGDIERVKVLDFGVARLAEGGVASTRTGVMLGTPGYMAPEQARGAKSVNARADVFSLGCVLFECVAGRAPFLGDHAMALLAKILLEDAPRLADVAAGISPELGDLVARMLAKEPEARPADASVVARELSTLGALREILPVAQASRAPAITAGEQRLLSVVLVLGTTALDELTAATNETVAQTSEPSLGRLAELVRGYGARFDRLADGTTLITLWGSGAATDQVARAARCALELRSLVPEGTMALATGRGVVRGALPIGEVIDRAQGILHAVMFAEGADRDIHADQAIRVDQVTAGLLDGRFVVERDEAGYLLVSERDVGGSATRLLLGRPIPCVGRDLELGVLKSAFAETVEEPGAHVVLITSPPGGGKTRVRQELVRALERSGAPLEVWIAQGDPASAGSPFAMLATAIRRAAGILMGEPLETRREKLVARVARRVRAPDRKRIVEFLGEIIGVPFPVDDVALHAARQEPVLMGDQMRRAFEDFLAAECAVRPLLLVLEDLQWGDLPSVSYIESALRHLHDQPVMVLALARPEVHRVFPRLWEERALQEIRLPELSKKSAERLVRAALGDSTKPDDVRRLVARAGGNAFYLEELVRAFAEGRDERLPETVLAMVEARLAALDSEARRVLRAASIFGQEFWHDGLAALLGGMSETDLGAWIGELLKSEVIVQEPASRFPNQTAYTFRQSLFADAAYATLTAEDRELGHRLAATWLIASGEEDSLALAAHFERGASPERAVFHHRRAAEQALGANDFEAAIARAERAIDCGADAEVLGSLRVLQADAHQWRGEFRKMFESSMEALEALPRPSAPWVTACAHGIASAAVLGEEAKMLALVDELESIPFPEIGLGPQLMALARAATRLSLAGHRLRAERIIARIGESAGDIDEKEPHVAARIMVARAFNALTTGDLGGYLEGVESAAASFERAGDLRSACLQHINVGHAHIEMGAYAEAERWEREALAGATRLGMTNGMLSAKQNLGIARAYQGALDEARELEEETAEAFAAQPNPRLESGSRRYLAIVHVLRGDFASADREARRAAEVARSLPPVRAAALAILARVAVARGDPRGALAAAQEATRLFDDVRTVETGEASIRLALAEALHASGDVAGARETIRVARERLIDRAARIPDPDHEKSFLENVPESAWTLELAARWLDEE